MKFKALRKVDKVEVEGYLSKTGNVRTYTIEGVDYTIIEFIKHFKNFEI
jgi:hypothetical protein